MAIDNDNDYRDNQLSVTLYWVGIDVEFLPGCHLYSAHLSRDFYHVELAEKSLKHMQDKFPQAAIQQCTLLYNKCRKTDLEEYRARLKWLEHDVKLVLRERRE